MTKVILTFTLAMVALQAQDIVHYDKKRAKKTGYSKTKPSRSKLV